MKLEITQIKSNRILRNNENLVPGRGLELARYKLVLLVLFLTRWNLPANLPPTSLVLESALSITP